jgi:hypothetical protein
MSGGIKRNYAAERALSDQSRGSGTKPDARNPIEGRRWAATLQVTLNNNSPEALLASQCA